MRLLEQLDVPGPRSPSAWTWSPTNCLRDEFDLVHTRLVLIHVAERDEVLRGSPPRSGPAAWLLVEEDDTYPIEANATGAYREAWDAFLRDDAGGRASTRMGARAAGATDGAGLD